MCYIKNIYYLYMVFFHLKGGTHIESHQMDRQISGRDPACPAADRHSSHYGHSGRCQICVQQFTDLV